MPNVVVIAGPNGVGKSTLAPALLRDTLNIPEDVIADIYNAGTEPASEIAEYDGVNGTVVLDNELWNQIKT